MPQATSELTEEWSGPSDETAIAFLKSAGYVLTKCWTWTPPVGHEPTPQERRAAEFLIQEWDFDGIELAQAGETRRAETACGFRS